MYIKLTSLDRKCYIPVLVLVSIIITAADGCFISRTENTFNLYVSDQNIINREYEYMKKLVEKLTCLTKKKRHDYNSKSTNR